MIKRYNLSELILKATNHLFMDNGSYNRKVNTPYVNVFRHSYWRFLALYHILDSHGYPRIAQVFSNFEDLLLDVDTYYSNQMYPDMRKTLLKIEKYIFSDALSEDIKEASRIEEARGNKIQFDIDKLISYVSVIQPVQSYIPEDDNIYSIFRKYKDLNFDEKKTLNYDELLYAVKSAFYTTYDLNEE